MPRERDEQMQSMVDALDEISEELREAHLSRRDLGWTDVSQWWYYTRYIWRLRAEFDRLESELNELRNTEI